MLDMKSKFIDVTPIIAGLKEMSGGTTYDALEYERRSIYSLIADMLESAPTADVVPVRHGAWRKIKIPPAGYDLHGYLCNLCGFVDEGVHSMTGKPFAYCPNCGARMDA